jgi:3-dehydroquinate synthase
MRKIHVGSDPSYEVTVGRNLLSALVKEISAHVNQVGLFFAPTMENIAIHMKSEISSQHPKVTVHLVRVPDGESAKTAEFVQSSWTFLGEQKFTRSDLLISVGGGSTTDVTGFIAASWLRGISVIHTPTTLLAMVDAAVGGKTGINTAAGKNLVGAFYNPKSVWCDLELLKSLPIEDLRAGFAEVVKCGFVSDLKIIELVEKNGEAILDLHSETLTEAIELAIEVKAKVVEADFKESQVCGLGREILNYGHTLGHAIENLENYTWRHGDAISVGMMFAANLSFKVGVCKEDLVIRQKHILQSLDLPVSFTGDFKKILDLMSIDKKARGSNLRFIGLSDFGQPIVINSPSLTDLEWAFEQISGGK